MLETQDFIEKTLREQFEIKELLSAFDIVYIGDDYDKACSNMGNIAVERYGQGGGFHVSPENMEMAIEKNNRIVAYVGENFTADKGEYIALVLKKAE